MTSLFSSTSQKERDALLTTDKSPVTTSYFPEIIGRSPAMLTVMETISKVATSDSPVLVLGESGTGKELVASAIHRLSKNARGCFFPLNCSAIPENLLEAELFGYEKGAFTGADKRRSGLFAQAFGGTIFLDEIGDMPLMLQAKLLRVLQEKTYRPLGSSEHKPFDARIVAATNADLQAKVMDKSFRLDLYYRLNVLPVRLPPLKERGDDIVYLIQHFIDIANRRHRPRNPCRLSPAAMQRLARYEWPGNVRQLQNLAERLVVTSDGGALAAEDLPEDFFTNQLGSPEIKKPKSELMEFSMTPTEAVSLSEGFSLTNYLVTIENDLILEALKKTGNNKNKAAQLLGLNRTTLVERIKKRGLLLETSQTD